MGENLKRTFAAAAVVRQGIGTIFTAGGYLGEGRRQIPNAVAGVDADDDDFGDLGVDAFPPAHEINKSDQEKEIRRSVQHIDGRIFLRPEVGVIIFLNRRRC